MPPSQSGSPSTLDAHAAWLARRAFFCVNCDHRAAAVNVTCRCRLPETLPCVPLNDVWGDVDIRAEQGRDRLQQEGVWNILSPLPQYTVASTRWGALASTACEPTVGVATCLGRLDTVVKYLDSNTDAPLYSSAPMTSTPGCCTCSGTYVPAWLLQVEAMQLEACLPPESLAVQCVCTGQTEGHLGRVSVQASKGSAAAGAAAAASPQARRSRSWLPWWCRGHAQRSGDSGHRGSWPPGVAVPCTVGAAWRLRRTDLVAGARSAGGAPPVSCECCAVCLP